MEENQNKPQFKNCLVARRLRGEAVPHQLQDGLGQERTTHGDEHVSVGDEADNICKKDEEDQFQNGVITNSKSLTRTYKANLLGPGMWPTQIQETGWSNW